MELIEGEGMPIRGKMGDLIFYKRGNKVCVRRVAIPGKPRKWEREGFSDARKTCMNRFAVVQELYRYFRREVSADIWRLAAREQGKMAHNLFYSTNYRCFDAGREVLDAEGFQFSAGSVLLPRDLAVTAGKEEGTFRVTWRETRREVNAAATDRLQVGVLYDAKPKAPKRAPEVSGIRGDGEGWFRLDPKFGLPAHVYLYFAREDGTAYSPSRCFRVRGKEDVPSSAK